MASWLERGRPAIFKALQDVCDQIDLDLSSELHDRDEKQHVFLSKEVERLRSRVADVDRLEQENRALKDEVTALRSQIKSATSAPDVQQLSATPRLSTRQPLGEISTNTPSRHVGLGTNSKETGNEVRNGSLAVELAELQHNHEKLAAKYEKLKHARDVIDARAHKFQSDRDQWRKYAESLEVRNQKLKKRLGRTPQVRLRSSIESTPPCPDLKGPGADTNQVEASVPALKTTLAPNGPLQTLGSSSFSGLENALMTDLSTRRAVSTPADARRTELAEESAISTQGDDDNISGGNPELPRLPVNDTPFSTLIKGEPSSDAPVVVSERRVGKRKHNDDGPDNLTPRASRRPKIENRSSDPIVTAESHHFSPQESLDLDTDGAIPTPRKARLLQMQDRSKATDLDNDNAYNGAGIFNLRTPDSGTVTDDVQTEAPAKVLHVFASPNRRTVSKTSTTPATAPLSRLRLNDGVASLAEDGYDPTRSGRERDDPSIASTARATRLDTLLNTSSPLPQVEATLLRPNRQSREAARSSPWLSDTPGRILPFGKGDGKDGHHTPASKSRLGANPDPAPANMEAARHFEKSTSTPFGKSGSKARSKPLREQPLASLRLEDFRINPKFNNGQDFAFTEVVRNKSERADIPGCVDPECCGKHFRPMAQAELEAAGPSLIHRASDITLLEDYLGDQVYKLGSMTRQEKEQLWLEAKTRELANKHGKHRHRFTRRQSPPGFWNADFPSTQEMHDDREEGEKREKRMIEERWREAMRDGGRWLFRDE